MINKKWKCHYRRFEISEANIWMLLNRQKWPSSWIDPNLNSKSHKINLQLFNKESNLDTLWYLFIVNSRNNHWKSQRKNSCKQRQYVYNWGDFSFPTLFPSLRHRNNWQDIASTDILCSDHAWPACRGGRLISLEASLVQCFAFCKTSSKHRGAIFLKIIVQNIASLSKRCDIFTRYFRFQKAHPETEMDKHGKPSVEN